MSSPAHRAALGFFRGGLIAAVSLAIAPAVGAPWRDLQSGMPAGFTQFILPITGFVLAAPSEGERLASERAAAWRFGCGGGAAGLVLMITAPQLQGLTGFEDPLVVVPYAVATSAPAFGSDGARWQPGRRARQGRPVAAVFAVGGTTGGLLGVLPFLVQRWGGAGWAEPGCS